MTEQEHEAILRNTLPLRAEASASWAQDTGKAKGAVGLPQRTIDEVSAAIEGYLTGRAHATTPSPPADGQDPPLSGAETVKAASDVAEFFGEGDDHPRQQEATDASLSELDRDVLRYFVPE